MEEEKLNWNIIYVDMYGSTINMLQVNNMTEQEATSYGGRNCPINRAIDDFKLEKLNYGR